MSKKDYYITEKNINRIKRNEPSYFLDPNTYKEVIKKIKKEDYHIYYPYKDSDKVIIYTKELPKIRLLEILSYEKITHREIMGSLFGLQIDSGLFGDIIITNNHYYIMVLEQIYSLIINEYNMVGNKHIKLKEVPLSVLENYERTYQELELIVSSLRIDNVISSIIGTSREAIKKKFQDDEIILNYETCHKINYVLKENDVFSIRKYGKYRFINIIKQSKKGHYLIRCNKYIDN